MEEKYHTVADCAVPYLSVPLWADTAVASRLQLPAWLPVVSYNTVHSYAIVVRGVLLQKLHQAKKAEKLKTKKLNVMNVNEVQTCRY